jgi:predicted HTH domain antitoxin
MQITIDLPDSLTQTDTFNEADWMREIAIALFRQEGITLDVASKIAGISIDDFYQLLVSRNLIAPPTDPDDDPDELILASLRTSLQQIDESKVHPISDLWEEIDA